MRPTTPILRHRARRMPPTASASWILRIQAALEGRGAGLVSLILVAVVGIGGYTQSGPNGFWVLLFLGVVVFEFQKRIDQGLPLMQIAALLAVLQWIVGPFLAYGTEVPVVERYSMYVEEAAYFSYALPGTAAFVFGLLAVGASPKQRGLLKFVKPDNFLAIGLILYGIGLFAKVAPGYIGGPAFAYHLVSQLSYVGVLYILFSRSPFRWPLVVLGLLPLFRTTAESAMFHDFLLWTALLFCFWYGMRKHTLWNKMVLLVSVFFFVFTIQAVKGSYRSKVWSGEEASLIEEVVGFWSGSDEQVTDEVLSGAIVRLNQGWIISAVLDNVPNEEPYAGGETVKDALVSAMLPRFLAPDKVGAGGQVNFRRFTGLDIASTTSMGISPLGEAYANYGRNGGVLLMLVFGLAFASFYTLCLKRAVKYPDFLFWIPLIFYQALKAETELVTVLNQITKGALVAFILHWVLIVWLIPHLFQERRYEGIRRRRSVQKAPAYPAKRP